MASRIYTSVTTVGSIDIYNVVADPSGALEARIGSLAVRSDGGNTGVYQNTDGSTTWTLLGSVAAPVTLLSGVSGSGTLPLNISNAASWNDVISNYSYIEWFHRVTFGAGTDQTQGMRIPTSMIRNLEALSILSGNTTNSDIGIVLVQFGTLSTTQVFVTAGTLTLSEGTLIAY